MKVLTKSTKFGVKHSALCLMTSVVAMLNKEGYNIKFEKAKELLPFLEDSLQTFANKPRHHRLGFFIEWTHMQGKKDFGFSYIAHYVEEILFDCTRMKWKKVDLGQVNTLTRKLQQKEGLGRSEAMSKAYSIMKQKLSISNQLFSFADACRHGQIEAIRPKFEGLNIGINGELDSSLPNKKACTLAFEVAGILAQLLNL